MKASFESIFFGAILSLVAVNSVCATQVVIAVARVGTNFTYTVFNNEPTNSNSYLDAFHLVVNAPIDVVGGPPGWSFETDNQTYVNWFSTDSSAPYANDIAPNASKSGFIINSKLPPELPSTSESLSYAVSSWNHTTNNSGSSATGSIEAPSITTVAAIFSQPSISNATFQSTLLGIPDYSYAVQSSTNLVYWSSVTTNISPSTLLETNLSTGPIRFYRADFIPTASAWEPD